MYLFSCALHALFVYSVIGGEFIPNDFESVLLGPAKCLDSSYWCINFTTSVECNAVTHCIQVEWQNVKPTSGSCGNCESEIQTIRKSINSNITKVVMQDLLEQLCDVSIITIILHHTCKTLIDQYVDYNFNELLDLLSSEINPAVLCRLLGFCLSTPKSAAVNANEEDAMIRFGNIKLHFPAKDLDLSIVNSFVGVSHCTWGPSQWCGNLTSARECNAHSYCLKNVWKNTKFPEDDDLVCHICKDMVKQAREQIQSNGTQQESLDTLEESCKLIPIKVIRKECIDIADQFVPDMLASVMNPTAVCSVAGLCNSPRIDKLIASNLGTNPELKPDTCVNCIVAFTKVKQFLHQNSKVDVMNRLLQVRGELSTFSDSYATLVTKYFDDLYKYLWDLQPWNACHLSRMCAYNFPFHLQREDADLTEKAELMLKQQSDDLPCDLCKHVVIHFRDELVVNATEDKFLQVSRGICKQTGKFDKECTELVDQNVDFFYDFLTQEFDSQKICAEVNFCSRNNLVSDINLNLIQDRFAPIINSQAEISSQTSVSLNNVTECRFCKYIIHLVQYEIKDPKIEKDVEKALEKVCNLVPYSDVAKCDKFVEQYSQLLIDLLAKETDASIVCATIDLCPDVYLLNKFAFCPLCQNVLHLIQTEVENPKNEQQIENFLKKYCNDVPEADIQQCKEFVTEYSVLVISILGEETNPTLVCPALKLCPTFITTPNLCQSCTQYMNMLISPLKQRNPLSIYKGLKTMMKSVPRNLTITAVQMQLEHSSEIVDMTMAEFTAEEICIYLKYCNQFPKTDNVLGGNIETFDFESWPNDIISNTVAKPSCEICELFVKLYENKLTSNTTEKELKELLTKYCNHLTDKELQQNCSSLVVKYISKFIELLKTDVTPRELCQLAKICPAFSSFDVLQKCRSCEAALGSLQGVLTDPYVMNAEFYELYNVCSYVGQKSRRICDMAIRSLGRQIEGIAFGIPSWYYCSKVKMCPYKSELIHFEECTRGESFWCRGNQTAVICDKLEYCRDKVWKGYQPNRI